MGPTSGTQSAQVRAHRNEAAASPGSAQETPVACSADITSQPPTRGRRSIFPDGPPDFLSHVRNRGHALVRIDATVRERAPPVFQRSERLPLGKR
jgi:hypothetical protein